MKDNQNRFEFEVIDDADGGVAIEENKLGVKRSTFLGGLATRVHRWFRLTPSFGPELVRHTLKVMDTQPGSVVLDPFSGAGTTLIESALEGHQAVGFEINPLLHFVCDTCLNWELSDECATKSFEAIDSDFHHNKAAAVDKSLDELGLTAPPIHNVHRWWRDDVLKDLLLLLSSIRKCSEDVPTKRFFELAVAGVLVPDLTNVTLGRLQLHFVDKSKHEINVWSTFERHAKSMIGDLAEVRQIAARRVATVLHTDATCPEVPEVVPLIDRVVTSPPYPNRYSYVWNTRPHLYMLGLFENSKQAAQLDLKTIGGTWGTATSILMKGVVPAKYPVIESEIMPVANQIRQHDNLMANYLTKYFNMLTDQIMCQDRLLNANAQLAYVVGCSRLKDVYVETDVLLAKVFEGLDLGYKVKKVERFRKRHSGKDLHESTVFVEKGIK